ncbi:MAG: hypothetical protein M1470_13425 [Bacteroidetes bacterium]|nr:hypothetical protein [Bacteroidota bacterium]MCL5738428.1 hypothetical protein [Bacteroidota bacterium]
MPVQKFKTFDEASKALWNFAPDEDYYKRVENFYKLASQLITLSAMRGIYKFHDLEEVEQHRMEFLLQNSLPRGRKK